MGILCICLVGASPYIYYCVYDIPILLAWSLGSSPRANDLTRQPAMVMAKNKKGGRGGINRVYKVYLMMSFSERWPRLSVLRGIVLRIMIGAAA